jgi:hypothetical protein
VRDRAAIVLRMKKEKGGQSGLAGHEGMGWLAVTSSCRYVSRMGEARVTSSFSSLEVRRKDALGALSEEGI